MEATIVLYGIVAALAELLGGSLVVLRKQWPKQVQEYLLALGAGFILALVFLELIPESLKAAGSYAPLYILLGYAVLHFFEHTIVGHLHFGEETHPEVMVSRIASISTFVGLFIHAFFDGFAISVGMRYDFYLGLLIFFAVLLHKIPEGLTIASVMLAAAHRRRTAFLASAAIGVATMLGIVSVFLLTDIDESIVGAAFAFTAGVATYVGASDLIPEINHSRNRIIPLLVFGGMLLFYGGTVLLGPMVGHAH
ncbi:MAG: Zinc/iron transporter [Bacteroidetes bacterium]|jgi:ZIP family zinc transporter/zinc and cadmium transporter|nr:Zinc/iron transporter [Bacteroidota bacterium]